MKPFLLSLLSFIVIVVATYGQSPMRKCDLQSSKTLIKNNHAFINPHISDTNRVTSYYMTVIPLASEQQLMPVIMSNERNYYSSSLYHTNILVTSISFNHIKNLFILNDNISLLTTKDYDNYIYEGSTSLEASFIWNPSKKLILDLTPDISSCFYGPQQLMSVVKSSISASLRYRLINWLSLKAFGEYNMDGNKLPAYSLLAPQNAFGAGVIVKLYKGIGIEAGIEEVNYNGKWHRNFYSNPTNY